jgi:hypothetical protein
LKPWFLSLPLACSLVASCSDPVQSNLVADLGPEVQGVRPGPLHRAGQPCLVCHSDNYGFGAPKTWSVAGTVYEAQNSPTPARGATVTLTDDSGKKQVLTTNAAGNFFVEPSRFTPAYPLKVTVEANGYAPAPMKTLINGAGACASCHRGNGSQGRMPGVYLGSRL